MNGTTLFIVSPTKRRVERAVSSSLQSVVSKGVPFKNFKKTKRRDSDEWNERFRTVPAHSDSVVEMHVPNINIEDPERAHDTFSPF